MEMGSLQKDERWTYKCQLDIEPKEVWALKKRRAVEQSKEEPDTGIPSVERHWENAATASQQCSCGAIGLPPQEVMSKELTWKNSGFPAPWIRLELVKTAVG